MLGTQKSVFFYVGLALGFNGTWDMTRGCKTRDALEYRVRSTTCKHVQTGARKESTVPVYFITHGLVKGGRGGGRGADDSAGTKNEKGFVRMLASRVIG